MRPTPQPQQGPCAEPGRSFFSALLRYLLEEKSQPGAGAELPVLFTVAFSDAWHRSAMRK